MEQDTLSVEMTDSATTPVQTTASGVRCWHNNSSDDMQGYLSARENGSTRGCRLPLPVGKEITEAALIALGEEDFKTWALDNVANAFSLPIATGKGDVYVPFCMTSSDLRFEFGIYTETKSDKDSFLAEVPGKPGVFSFQPPDNTTRLKSIADRASYGGKGLRVTSLVFPAPAEGVEFTNSIDCYLSPVCSGYADRGKFLDSEQQSILEEAIRSANIKGYLPAPSPGSTQGDS